MSFHFVLSAKPGSHTRSLSVLASKIASARPITVTYLVPNISNGAAQVSAEVARSLKSEGPPKGEVRVVAVGPHSDADTDASLKIGSFRATWTALIAGSPVECASTGVVYPPAARPSLAILDGFELPWLYAIRSMDSPPPILQWMPGFSGAFLSIVGSEDVGGRGDFYRAIADDKLDSLKDSEEEPQGTVIRIAGMPPMYDWEFFPQQIGSRKGKNLAAYVKLSRFVVEADGLVTGGAVPYDGPECLASMSAWVARTNDRPTFHLGPVMAFNPGTTEFSQASKDAELAASCGRTGARVSEFLDRAYERHGEHGVVYICFGTEYWPSSMDHLSVLLYALERRKIPFLFAHASSAASIPDDLRAHFDQSETAMLVPWAPQQTVLAHKACGWFVTHAGSNSTMEAVSQGIPMVCWPFAADQPMNAARLVHVLDVAFELFEARTGTGAGTGASLSKPIFATGRTPAGTLAAFEAELDGTLEAMYGAVGARKRANARRVREGLAGAWREDGEARWALERLLNRYCTT